MWSRVQTSQCHVNFHRKVSSVVVRMWLLDQSISRKNQKKMKWKMFSYHAERIFVTLIRMSVRVRRWTQWCHHLLIVCRVKKKPKREKEEKIIRLISKWWKSLLQRRQYWSISVMTKAADVYTLSPVVDITRNHHLQVKIKQGGQSIRLTHGRSKLLMVNKREWTD